MIKKYLYSSYKHDTFLYLTQPHQIREIQLDFLTGFLHCLSTTIV